MKIYLSGLDKNSSKEWFNELLLMDNINDALVMNNLVVNNNNVIENFILNGNDFAGPMQLDQSRVFTIEDRFEQIKNSDLVLVNMGVFQDFLTGLEVSYAFLNKKRIVMNFSSFEDLQLFQSKNIFSSSDKNIDYIYTNSIKDFFILKNEENSTIVSMTEKISNSITSNPTTTNSSNEKISSDTKRNESLTQLSSRYELPKLKVSYFSEKLNLKLQNLLERYLHLFIVDKNYSYDMAYELVEKQFNAFLVKNNIKSSTIIGRGVEQAIHSRLWQNTSTPAFARAKALEFFIMLFAKITTTLSDDSLEKELLNFLANEEFSVLEIAINSNTKELWWGSYNAVRFGLNVDRWRSVSDIFLGSGYYKYYKLSPKEKKEMTNNLKLNSNYNNLLNTQLTQKPSFADVLKSRLLNKNV